MATLFPITEKSGHKNRTIEPPSLGVIYTIIASYFGCSSSPDSHRLYLFGPY